MLLLLSSDDATICARIGDVWESNEPEKYRLARSRRRRRCRPVTAGRFPHRSQSPDECVVPRDRRAVLRGYFCGFYRQTRDGTGHIWKRPFEKKFSVPVHTLFDYRRRRRRRAGLTISAHVPGEVQSPSP